MAGYMAIRDDAVCDQLTVPPTMPAWVSPSRWFLKEGLPIGIQLLGADFSEAALLRMARSYEMATEQEDWRKKSPAVLEGE
jgi:aspartyl-tRNA(Asn)/glutamyl-tRNA(Gln) amidotransferase subunit A